jgi:hypothetical protein
VAFIRSGIAALRFPSAFYSLARLCTFLSPSTAGEQTVRKEGRKPQTKNLPKYVKNHIYVLKKWGNSSIIDNKVIAKVREIVQRLMLNDPTIGGM